MPNKKSQSFRPGAALAPILVLGAADCAWAHESAGHMGGLVSGFMHPLLGWDHLLAMVAVGIWAAFIGASAMRRLPLLFLLLMAAGAVLGVSGVPMPAVEAGIAASAIVLGLVVAAALAPSPATAGVIVGGFAILHGHAHGAELPQAAGALGYAAGFIVATGLLHLAGIGIGSLLRWPAGRIAVRAAGGAIALAGTAMLFGLA